MRIVPLQTLPNQEFSLQIDDNNYDLRIHDCGDIIAVSMIVNNIIILSGQRAVNGFPIIPYNYLEINIGNFIFVSANDSQDQYPDWRRFNMDLIFLYVTPQELRALRFLDFIREALRATRT